MSEFSELLTHYVHSKDVKTYALAQYCGLDRSNMYKIINGKRKPASADIVTKICKFLHLLPAALEPALHCGCRNACNAGNIVYFLVLEIEED